jgi:CheY-like chemotaxis protein
MENKDALKLVIIEDDENWPEIILEILEDLNVHPVAIVNNIVEATEKIIPQLESLGVQVVILDGNLSPGRNDGQEGRTMAAQIREQAPSVRIVGLSAGDQDYLDTHLNKGNFELDDLRNAILGE